MFNKQTILARARWLSDCVIFDETDSTQREAKASGRANCLYLTNQQLATYGRFGRAYFASSEGGIYMSVCLRPQVAFDELPQYTLLAAAAVVSAIEKLTDKKPLIKWVNDIYLGDKKIVGILTEATTRVTRESQIILGMGINFAISEFPSALTERATSLFFDEPPTISADNLIGEIWAQFEQLQHADFMAIYKAHSFILGKKITFTQSGQDFTGRAMDLSAQGELIVACDDGTTKILNSGEISLTSWN